jgi:hypothetical protein
MSRRLIDFRRLGRGTKPNIIDEALPNLPNTGLYVQALSIKNLIGGGVLILKRGLLFLFLNLTYPPGDID